MASKHASLVHVDEEDCIDIELNSYSIIDTPPQNREFEFQNKKESTTSPADELFYKGTLLPLHLPPRLEMVEKLLQDTDDATFPVARSHSSLDDSRLRYTINAITPLESCNISPLESRRVSSCESLPPEFQFDWSSEIEGLVSDHNVSKKQHCSKNLKQNKQFWLAQRLKASRDYLKSLFSKSGCSDKSSTSDAEKKVGVVKKPKCKECQNKYVNKNRNNSFEFFCDNKHKRQGSCTAVKNSEMVEDGFISSSRRSFSGVSQRHYASKASSLSVSSSGSSSLSSSFSLSSAGSYELHLFNKSLSKELENSIQGAIAYCKKSQQEGSSNKVCSLSAVCGHKDIIKGSTWLNQRRVSEKVEKILVEKNEFLI